MLGIVLSPYGKIPGSYPYEINKSGPNLRTFYCPYDPYYQQRGEAGFYHDTALGRLRGLGAIPTDAELAKAYQWYTPVQSAWIQAIDPTRYITGPWVPPDNANSLPGYGPEVAFNGNRMLRGLGDGEADPLEPVPIPTNAPTTASAPSASANDVIAILNEYHKKQFTLSALGAAAGVAASLIAFYRTFHGIKDDRRRRERESAQDQAESSAPSTSLSGLRKRRKRRQ